MNKLYAHPLAPRPDVNGELVDGMVVNCSPSMRAFSGSFFNSLQQTTPDKTPKIGLHRTPIPIDELKY